MVRAHTDPEQKWNFFLVVTQDQNALAGLTLRQLRLKASDLGVPLYSRKSKALLVKEIIAYEHKKLEAEREKVSLPFWRAPEQTSKGSEINKSQSETRVVFLPRDPQWAYVFWEISESDRKRAQSKGAHRLCLRLSDLTGINDGTAHRQTLQEVPVDSHNTEWYLPIPLSDRDYRVELGYRSGERWISLAFSSTARVPSLSPSSQILDQFVPFSLDQSSASTVPPEFTGSNDQGDSGLHERLYQSATTHFRQMRIGSEEFQENNGGSNFDSSLNDSGSGLWASGRNESGVGGVMARKRPFWLVADSELVVYGSTDPSASVTIGGEEVPLSSAGTFRLQVPFRDGLQEYPIEAKDLEGNQTRNITMKFERRTPIDNTNPSDQGHDEWF